MKKTLNRIREKIKKEMSPKDYADKIGISRTTLYNFLNGQSNIKFDGLEKIIKPIGMDILEGLPPNLKEIGHIQYGDVHLKVGEYYEEKKVLLCFGSASSSHQMVVFESADGEKEIKVF